MKYRRMFVNPLDFKWSGTPRLTLFATKREEEWHTAILPVLVVRDTKDARKALRKPDALGALHEQLKATADKLSWLYEAQETDREISARDLLEIRKQLKAARAAIKNLKP